MTYMRKQTNKHNYDTTTQLLLNTQLSTCHFFYSSHQCHSALNTSSIIFPSPSGKKTKQNKTFSQTDVYFRTINDSIRHMTWLFQNRRVQVICLRMKFLHFTWAKHPQNEKPSEKFSNCCDEEFTSIIFTCLLIKC